MRSYTVSVAPPVIGVHTSGWRSTVVGSKSVLVNDAGCLARGIVYAAPVADIVLSLRGSVRAGGGVGIRNTLCKRQCPCFMKTPKIWFDGWMGGWVLTPVVGATMLIYL